MKRLGLWTLASMPFWAPLIPGYLIGGWYGVAAWAGVDAVALVLGLSLWAFLELTE